MPKRLQKKQRRKNLLMFNLISIKKKVQKLPLILMKMLLPKIWKVRKNMSQVITKLRLFLIKNSKTFYGAMQNIRLKTRLHLNNTLIQPTPNSLLSCSCICAI